MMQSIEAVRAFAAIRTDEVVVTTMTSIFQWDDIVGDDPLHLPLIGSMGKAADLALGVAIARPDVRVWCIDGDGSLLMNLGVMASIVTAKPKNLVHAVLANGAYNITGGQPIPAATTLDFAMTARAAGYPVTTTIDDLDALRAQLPSLVRQDGPVFVAIKCQPAGPQPKIQHGRMAKALLRLRDTLAARQPGFSS